MPSLLADDPNPTERSKALTKARDAYGWDHEYLAPLPMLHLINRPAKNLEMGILDFLRGTFEAIPAQERPDDGMTIERLEATTPGVLTLQLDELEKRFGRLTDPMDYEGLTAHLHTPPHLAGNASYGANWDDDATFAWQRLAGPNPMSLERPDDAGFATIQAKLQLTDAHVQNVLGDTTATVDGARRAGLLSLTDYWMLNTPGPLPCSVKDGRQTSLPAPVGAFVWHPTRKVLLPAAIRLGQDATAPLATPSTDGSWAVAKAMYSVADFHYHEMVVHLMGVHFLQEGIAVATHRSLPPQHPVYALLVPHLRYLLFNNFAGREFLVEEHGYVDKIMSADLVHGSLELVKRGYTHFHFDHLDVPLAIGKRGMMSQTGLPDFPYRDDALLIWAAIDTWTRSYIAAYYRDDAAVANDTELHRWCTEMVGQDGARLNGFPEQFTCTDRLANALSRLIFLASAQHSAVNFSQQASMSIVPNMPGACFDSSARTLMDMLPPLATAHTQVEAIWLLTCFKYGTLGQYGGDLTDDCILRPMNTFHQHLSIAERTIHQRNLVERKGREYCYLQPSRIPNSSNI
jgi:arachidonate 15-lipoxygenase